MRFHYDWEFKEDGVTIEPISLGMVDDYGKELYLIYVPAINSFRRRQAKGILDSTDLWLQDNVFNHISFQDEDDFGCASQDEMAAAVYDFICESSEVHDDWNIELWGYFASYDHVCLSQLFGRMIDLPAPMPMYTNELMTIRKGRAKPARPADLPQHHSLMDARYQKMIYDEWSKDAPQ
jgi:hypothetical protein